MKKVLEKPTWFLALEEMFGRNEINEEDPQITDPTLVESHMSVDKKGKITEKPIVTEGRKSSNNGGGIKKKYETPILEVKEMSQENLDKMVAKLRDDDRIK